MSNITTNSVKKFLITLSKLESLALQARQISERARELESNLYTTQQDIYRLMIEETRTEDNHE